MLHRAVPQSDTNGRGRHTLHRQLAKLLAEILRLQLEPARGPALVRECRRRHTLARPIHASHGRLFAQYNTKTQTRKTDKRNENSSNRTGQHNTDKNLRTVETKTQNHNLGLATPDKGFPKGNCPASERKPRSSAQKRLDRTCKRHGQMILRTKTFGSPKENATHSRKGALTTARPLLVNASLTGETCAKNFADICYTASGSRAESQLHPTKRIKTAK